MKNVDLSYEGLIASAYLQVLVLACQNSRGTDIEER